MAQRRQDPVCSWATSSGSRHERNAMPPVDLRHRMSGKIAASPDVLVRRISAASGTRSTRRRTTNEANHERTNYMLASRDDVHACHGTDEEYREGSSYFDATDRPLFPCHAPPHLLMKHSPCMGWRCRSRAKGLSSPRQTRRPGTITERPAWRVRTVVVKQLRSRSSRLWAPQVYRNSARADRSVCDCRSARYRRQTRALVASVSRACWAVLRIRYGQRHDVRRPAPPN